MTANYGTGLLNLSSPRTRHKEYHYNHHHATVPIPANFVVTSCYIHKLKFSWSPVQMNIIGTHSSQHKFEYQIFAKQAQGARTKRKITSECEAIIENLIAGEYTFEIRAIEISAGLASDFSRGLDFSIPKDNKNVNTSSDTPREAIWLSNENNVSISWSSPHSFYGDISYELLFNNKVLGHCYVPPLILKNKEVESFDFSQGTFKLRSIFVSKEKKEKTESNCIQVSYPDHIRQFIKEHQNEMITEEKEEKENDEPTNDNALIYIWVCAAQPLPDLTLIPFGDPEFHTHKFKTLDQENGIYLCAWPSYFVEQLDHYFLFAIGDPNIHLAAVPTYDIHYKGYWRAECKEQIKFFLLYTHKVIHRVAHAMSGGMQGMYHKYTPILKCIIEHMEEDIPFKAAMKSMLTMHHLWAQQKQLLYTELQQLLFSKMEYYADCVDFEAMDVKDITVMLLCMYWLLKISYHKVHYRHLHHALNGLMNILQSEDNTYENVVDLISDILGSYVIKLWLFFQHYSLEKLKKDRSRYFDLMWYQILYLAAQQVSNMDDIQSKHDEFMSQVTQILFNPNCMAKCIGAEDLRAITQIYIALLKPQKNGRFYDECGVKLEEIIVENHMKSEDIMENIEFVNKNELSFHIFAKILYRNRNLYSFTEYSDGKEFLPALNIVSDHKTNRVLGRSGFYIFVQQQKITTEIRSAVIHLIFTNFKTYKDLNEKQLFLWYKVIQKLILKHKDFQVCDQILYEMRALHQRNKDEVQKHDKKYLKSFQDESHPNIMQVFEASLPICLCYTEPMIPHIFTNISLMNSKHLYHILSVLLHFRHSKCENIDNETEDDFNLHLFGILMMEFNEWFFAEKYLMKAILKQPNHPYGTYYADLALLKIVKHNDFVAAFHYISAALHKKHTECYNIMVLIILYQHLVELNHFMQNNDAELISTKRFDLNNRMFCNYYEGDKQSGMKDDEKQHESDDDESKWIDTCLGNYYNALHCLQSQQYKEAIQLIDEIYKYINNLNVKHIQKKCRTIIETINASNTKAANQNQAVVKSENDLKGNSEQNEDDDDRKEEIIASNMVMYMPPDDDSD